ncbi:MAG: hypothetical protein PHY41_06040, partial [Candidatus Cloacimonetes bacterium]|nr:hypothetical protein [Candidatus Cloacimonadota bacterium]
RPKVLFSLRQLRCLCQTGAWQPKQQHKRQHKRICDGIASSGCYKCGYKPHPLLGWQALVATKAEGLFLPLAASLPLPSGAWQPKQQPKRQHKRICGGIASSGCYKFGHKPHLPLGWQALFATKAEGLFSLAASLPLPSGAWQPKQQPKRQHKRLILPKCFSLPLWIFQVAIMLYLQEYHSLNHA